MQSGTIRLLQPKDEARHLSRLVLFEWARMISGFARCAASRHGGHRPQLRRPHLRGSVVPSNRRISRGTASCRSVMWSPPENRPRRSRFIRMMRRRGIIGLCPIGTASSRSLPRGRSRRMMADRPLMDRHACFAGNCVLFRKPVAAPFAAAVDGCRAAKRHIGHRPGSCAPCPAFLP
jgi:hypothetical protein